jgi:ABC-type sugar transport system permease subunit
MFLLPAYTLYTLFIALPIVAALTLSVLELDRITLDITFVGFGNYDWVLNDPRFWKTFRNTFFFISMSVIGNVGGALVLAVMMDRKYPNLILYCLRLAYFLPVLTSLAFVSFIWKFLFSTDLGVVNYYIQQLGFNKVGWLSDASVAMFSIILVDVWKNVGFFIIIILAALQGIPRTLMDAAKIDGASETAILWRIKMPFIAPVLLFLVTFATIGGLQVFDSIRIMTNGGPGDATRSVVMYMLEEAFTAGESGTGAVAALILFVVISLVVAAQYAIAHSILPRK